MSWVTRHRPSRRRRTAGVSPRSEPWSPPLLDAVPDEVLARLTYLAVDDLDGGDVVLVAAPWPRIDDLGRVRHAPGEAVEVGMPIAAWHELLAARRVPEVLRERPVRIGDAFAALLGTAPVAGATSLDLVGPVVDVTADARDASRAAFYGAVATPLGHDEAGVLHEPEPANIERIAPPPEWVEQVGSGTGAGR